MEPLTEEYIKRLENVGFLDPDCDTCKKVYYPIIRTNYILGKSLRFPGHVASKGCESGKRPHCTCDACF